MSNPWFRMYHEFSTDPKVQRLSEKDQRRYVMLLCMRCMCNVTETVTETLRAELCNEMSNENIVFMLRISNEEWQETKAILVSKKLIDDDNIPVSWDKRQHVSDSSKTRVAAYRERKKLLKQQVIEEESAEIKCNVTDALQKRKSNAIDTDTDTDTDTDINNKNTSIFIVEEIFDFWKKTFGHEKSVLDSKRKKIIKDALKLHDAEYLKTAITGCSLTPHNMGKNDRHEIYDGLHIIFKNADQIDRFVGNAKVRHKPVDDSRRMRVI